MRRGALAALLASALLASASPAVASELGLLAFGESNQAQLGVDDTVPSQFAMYGNVFEPAPLGTLSGVASVSVGYAHGLAVIQGGAVVAWGGNEHGQLGLGEATGPQFCEAVPCSRTPVTVPGVSGVTAVAAGGFHSLALLSNGTVMAWGSDSNGQLGIGAFGGNVAKPTLISGLSGVKAVAAGPEQSFAVMADGSVKAWGANESGALGLGGTSRFSVPTTVPGLSGVDAVAAAGWHGLALHEDGTVSSWGSNTSGQVGDGSQSVRTEPVALGTLNEVRAVAAGEDSSTALLANGTVMQWGTNRDGELGVGTLSGPEECTVHAAAPAPCSTVPVAVPGLSRVTQVAGGRTDTLVLLEGGAVMGWGWNEYGMLGNGEARGEVCGGAGHCSDSPTAVSALNDAVAIAAGGFTGFAEVALGPNRPALSAVSPIAGPQGHPTTITITGSNLSGATAVTIGSAPVSFTANSETSITAMLPALPAQILDVSVRTPEGYSAFTAADRYAYERLPEIFGLSPSSAPTVGGTSVTITGSQFSGVKSVKFGGASASFTVTSATAVTAIVPAAPAGTINVTVTNTDGTSNGQKFKYTPIVSSVSPNSGPAAGGTSVTVTGTGFALGAGTIFKFGSGAAKSVSCSSSTSCTMLTPAHAAGKVAVKATVNKVTSPTLAKGDQYTYF
jgi:alpha-tubulin suppressor-like RCC1 family protein